MLHVFAQAHAPGVRTDRFTELRGHEHDGKIFVQASHSCCVNLNDVDCIRLEELLEDNPVLTALAGRNLDGADSLPNLSMSQNVVRRSGFLNKP